MIEKLQKLRKLMTEVVATALTFLCLGIIVQLLIDDTLIGWDPVGNIKDAGSAFIGIIAIVLLYILFIKKK
ncbi:MAG: hypothetical protein HOI39_00515 [Flavobacteriales bacterium]|jgi:hypothetical protein|nr:hypothetical protein [Flavobacteriales bacterium]